MENHNDRIWQAKLLAWTHDPAEKALVLLRDPAGHEGGTVKELRKKIFREKIGVDLLGAVNKADRWAAAADRPQFPRVKEGGPYQEWAQVRFDKSPVLIHPLSGEQIKVGEGFADVAPDQIKAVSFDHFSQLIIETSDDRVDWRKTALAFWRFGPELPAREIGSLWQVLPADTRVPDHTIWTHLDLTSAFAGAFAADQAEEPALVAVSFGPVQNFIAQARSISDLWAGSHLLSMICWQGLKVVCEDFGPDAVIYPQLRGVPLVDVWLTEQGIPREKFQKTEWMRFQSDANPLFAAALPNKFVAVVPASRAEALTSTISERTRAWVKEQALKAVHLLIDKGGVMAPDLGVIEEQVDEQLRNFPEVHWAVVPWSLSRDTANPKKINTQKLGEALAAFSPAGDSAPGFLGSHLWKILSEETQLRTAAFFSPNPGVLYPAFYDLLERVHSASKSARFFEQIPQQGIRCSICGEREWLTPEKEALNLSPGQRTNTLWAKIAERRQRWAKRGEHLCALCTLKRLWPDLFVESIRPVLEIAVGRYVVSTHTMALATSLDRWLDRLAKKDGQDVIKDPDFLCLGSYTESCDNAALPKSLHLKLETGGYDAKVAQLARRLPALLDELRERMSEQKQGLDQEKAEEDLRRLEEKIRKVLGKTKSGKKPLENYYGLILMDGDRMGSWLTAGSSSVADRGSFSVAYKDRWHPDILAKGEAYWKGEIPALGEYLSSVSAPSPGRHMAVSSALNAFSLYVAPYIVETLFKGKLIYAGGDDLMAMVSVDDLLSTMLLLRLFYSGFPFGQPEDLETLFQFVGAGSDRELLRSRKGYVGFKKRLLRVMGTRATASMGAVVAHHTAPLAAVLRLLRAAERRAKDDGKRDAFSITVLKRAGGALCLTAPWLVGAESAEAKRPQLGSMGLLLKMRDALNDPDMSRRAAYIIGDWIGHLPDAGTMGDETLHTDMLAKNLAFQLRRQCQGKPRYEELGEELVSLAIRAQGRTGEEEDKQFIKTFIAVAEFFMREGRVESTGEHKEVGHA